MGRKTLTAVTFATMGKYKWWLEPGGIEVKVGVGAVGVGVSMGDEKNGVGRGAL